MQTVSRVTRTLGIVFSLFIGVVLFSSCATQEKREVEAKADVQDAKDDVVIAKEELKEVEKEGASDAEREVFAEEWKAFKVQSELAIKENEARIEALRAKMKTAGKKMDAAFENRIDTLRAQNKRLQDKMNSYDSNTKDWDTFKTEFNSDMDNLGRALKDFTSKNNN